MSDTSDPRVGEPFTRIEREPPGERRPDHLAWRRRLAGYVVTRLHKYHWTIRACLHVEMGIGLGYLGSRPDFESFFDEQDIDTVLNSITFIWQSLNGYGDPASSHRTRGEREAFRWREFVARSLAEEHMAYRVDERCGVRYLVDEGFERNRQAAIDGLSDRRYVAVRDALEHAYDDLLAQPMDRIGAVRQIFEAVETLVRLMTGENRLSSNLVNGEIRNRLQQHFGGQNSVDAAIGRLAASFASWVDALHNYRHGQPEPERAVPPLEMTIYALDTGAAMIRWLIELDQAEQSAQEDPAEAGS